MIAFTITLISLICLVRGDVGWSEFGRYRNDVNTFPSRIRINKEDDSVKSKEQKVIMEKKSSINFIDERYDCFKSFLFSFVIIVESFLTFDFLVFSIILHSFL